MNYSLPNEEGVFSTSTSQFTIPNTAQHREGMSPKPESQQCIHNSHSSTACTATPSLPSISFPSLHQIIFPPTSTSEAKSIDIISTIQSTMSNKMPSDITSKKKFLMFIRVLIHVLRKKTVSKSQTSKRRHNIGFPKEVAHRNMDMPKYSSQMLHHHHQRQQRETNMTQHDSELYVTTIRIIRECIHQNRQRNPKYSNLIESIQSRLCCCEGMEVHWNCAIKRFEQFLISNGRHSMQLPENYTINEVDNDKNPANCGKTGIHPDDDCSIVQV